FLAGQNGPGATNLATGLAQARAAYSPVIALAGSLSSAHVYRAAFQGVDQQSLFAPTTKKTFSLTQTARIPEMVGEWFRTAPSPRQGPALPNLPADPQAEALAEADYAAVERAYVADTNTGGSQAIEAAAQLPRNAQCPLSIVGGGVKNGRHQQEVAKL